MKVMYRLGCCMLAALLSSCLVESNDSPEETRIVIDQMQYDYILLVEHKKSKHEYRLYYTFTYDQYGRVSLLSIEGQLDIYKNGGYFEYNQVHYSYSKEGNLTQVTYVDQVTNAVVLDYSFEYNEWGKPIRLREKIKNKAWEYRYNATHQLVEFSQIENGTSTIFHLTYDEMGHFVYLVDNQKNERKSITYEERKTPFSQMNLDFTYANFAFTKGLIPWNESKVNIKSIVENDKEWKMDYVYDEQYGLPTYQVLYESDNRTKIREVTQFTYKEIKVKK